MKLKAKTLLLIIIPVFVLFALIISFASITLYSRETVTAEKLAESMSNDYGKQMQMYLEKAMDSARTLAEMSGALVEQGDISREGLDYAIKSILQNNDNFYGAWVGFEANAFDGKDAEFANKDGYDATGREIPYWYRDGNQLIRYYLEGYEKEGAGDFYLVPLKTGKEFITEPTEYELGGKKVLMTSLTVPIKSNGKIIGVAGIDITLEQLMAINNELKLYQNGYGRLISAKGVTVTHKDPNKIGKLAEDFESNKAAALFQLINSGKQFTKYTASTSSKDKMFNAFSPIHIGKSDIYWVYGTVIPVKEIYKEVNSTIQLVIVIGLVCLIILGGIILLIAEKITSPIIAITQVLNKQSKLDFSYDGNSKALKFIHRKDEIGSMIQSVNVMEENVRNFIMKAMDSAQLVAASSDKLTTTSEQAATASEEIAKTITEIAKGSSEQAQDTEIVSGKIQEMGDLLEENERDIVEMNNAFQNINHQKEEGFSILDHLIEKTNQSNASTEKIFKIIVSNNESAEKIENASTMIQSIAEQTNLLSLNASIEAARAGEAGKGFAVVANEIGKLAEQTNRFTDDIMKVIGDLKAKSENAVTTMTEVKAIVNEQTDSVKQTESKFESIAIAMHKADEIIIKLNQSIAMMISNKNMIIDLTSNLSAISEENAAGTQETSAATEEQSATITEIANSAEGLANIAAELQTMVKKFKYE